MQITKTNPSRYTSNCILLREKLLLQQSVHRPHFDNQVLWLRPLENTLCSGQPATLGARTFKRSVVGGWWLVVGGQLLLLFLSSLFFIIAVVVIICCHYYYYCHYHHHQME